MLTSFVRACLECVLKKEQSFPELLPTVMVFTLVELSRALLGIHSVLLRSGASLGAFPDGLGLFPGFCHTPCPFLAPITS